MAFPILVAVGNLVDPPATMINSSGDYVVSFLVSRFVDGKTGSPAIKRDSKSTLRHRRVSVKQLILRMA